MAVKLIKERFSIPNFEDTETLLKYRIPTEDIEAFEKVYLKEVESGHVDEETKFSFAWCLVHSDSSNVKKALPLFEDLFKCGNEQMKRDSLFYLALGNTKLKEYFTAKKYIESFLSIEPANDQVKQLESYVKSYLVKDGLTGLALTGVTAVACGVAAVAIGGIMLTTGIGMTLVRAIKKK